MSSKALLTLPESYLPFLEEVKTRIQESQIKAAIAVNQELIKLHWWLGKEIVTRQESEKWGSQVIDKFCKDIQSGFPGLKGFSRSNVFYMRMFYTTYEIVQRPIGQLETPPSFCLNIPWGHNISLMEKVKTLQEREWYARASVEHGWSRPILELWIRIGTLSQKRKSPQ